MQERPDTATLYCELSQQFLRWHEGELEVYCKYAAKWKPSAIRDFKLARVVKL